jgi:hypothetical protein
MTTQNYLMINESTNVVDNVCEWDGNPDTWQPPANTLMLVQLTTPAMIWGLNADKTDYVLVQEIGQGQIGFTWDGTVCTTNQPKPEVPQQCNTH